jgi:hypothetical protein
MSVDLRQEFHRAVGLAVIADKPQRQCAITLGDAR